MTAAAKLLDSPPEPKGTQPMSSQQPSTEPPVYLVVGAGEGISAATATLFAARLADGAHRQIGDHRRAGGGTVATAAPTLRRFD